MRSLLEFVDSPDGVLVAYLLTKKTELDIEVTIEKGIGYEPKDQRKIKKSEIGVITLDAIFTPIKSVSFNVENMRVGDRTDYDKLSLNIETDGTLTPEEAFYQATEILIKHFGIIFEGKATELPKKAKTEAKEGKVKEKVKSKDKKPKKKK